MATAQSSPAPAAAEPRHGLRIFLIWLVATIILELIIWLVWWPHMQPGAMTSSSRSQQFDIAVMATAAAPVLMFIWVYLAYALITWRRRPGDDGDGPALTGTASIQATWIVATSVIVLGLFVFGTVELIVPAGAGAGQGPAPIWKPANAVVNPTSWTPGPNNMLEVQVIGQEWAFTYRYPQFGGMESTQLLLPIHTHIEFHVTSLDVIHSFWPYLLGVKADANPGVDNVAYTTAQQLGPFVVRCNELCGLWHGAMFNSGYVLSPAKFQTWARGVQAREQHIGLLAALPPYSRTYDPTVVPQLGRAVIKIDGITGANGYYYPGPQAGTPGDPVSP
jgi:cytochrome c oxidase subunit II